MSTFDVRIELDADGTHGCQRDIKDGQIVKTICGDPNCPDCLTRQFVSDLKRQGHQIQSAKFINWPGQPTEVTDNLLTGIRTGSFY